MVPRADHVLERRRGRVGGRRRASSRWPAPPTSRRSRTCSRCSVPTVLAPAEAAQASNGGGNPRLGDRVRRARPDGAAPRRASTRCVVVTDVPASGAAIARRAHVAWRRVRRRRSRRRGAGLRRAAAGAAPRPSPARPGRSMRVVVGAPRWHARPPRRRPASRPGSACSTSTPGSPTGSAPTRLGPGGRRSLRRRPTGPSGSSPSSTPRPPGAGAGPRRRRSSPAPRTRRRPTGSTPSRSAWRPRRRRRAAGGRGRGLPGVRRRRRRAVRRGARRRRRSGSACAAIRSPAGTISFGGPGRPRLARRRAPRPWSPAGRTPVADTRRSDVRTHRAHRRRAHPPVGSGARRLVPVPGRPAGAGHG